MLSTPVFLSTTVTAVPTRPSARRAGTRSTAATPQLSLPTRLRPHDLLRITDQGASDVLGGRFDDKLPAAGAWPTGERWSTRLHSDDDLDVWLISWVPDRSTELHDHAGSLGALTVLSGSLVESRWAGNELKRRRLDAGDQAAFPLGWVHDVMRAPTSDAVNPTLSVHAYSPPLTAMSYYEVTGHSSLRRTRTELTDEPEGPSK